MSSRSVQVTLLHVFFQMETCSSGDLHLLGSLTPLKCFKNSSRIQILELKMSALELLSGLFKTRTYLPIRQVLSSLRTRTLSIFNSQTTLKLIHFLVVMTSWLLPQQIQLIKRFTHLIICKEARREVKDQSLPIFHHHSLRENRENLQRDVLPRAFIIEDCSQAKPKATFLH